MGTGGLSYAPGAANCCECGRQIPDVKYVYQKVTGWERHREQGGTNVLHLRRPHDAFMCNVCMDKLRNGVNALQEDLGV